MKPATFTCSSAALTHQGNLRDHNEDACLDGGTRRFWVVADGMGGHDSGDYASALIVERLRRLPGGARPSETVDRIEDELLDVNRHLYALSAQRHPPTIIGSTVVVLMAFDGFCVVAWAGDSRAYRLRDGQISRISRDHSEVQLLVERALVKAEDAENHPRANVITRAVGGAAELTLDYELLELQSGDRFLLCSDGLYKDVAEAQMADVLRGGDCHQASRALLDLSLSREAKDNVTVVTVDCFAARSPPPPRSPANVHDADMAAQRLKKLVEAYERRFLDWADYRSERGRLLDEFERPARLRWRRPLAALADRLGIHWRG